MSIQITYRRTSRLSMRIVKKAESEVQKLKARLVSLQETLGVVQQVIAEGIAEA